MNIPEKAASLFLFFCPSRFPFRLFPAPLFHPRSPVSDNTGKES